MCPISGSLGLGDGRVADEWFTVRCLALADSPQVSLTAMIRCLKSVTSRNAERLMERRLTRPNRRPTWFSQEA